MSNKVMSLGSILESLDSTTEKVAADHSVNDTHNVSSTVETSKKELLSSLNEGTTKVAAVNEGKYSTPEGDLEKIASEVAQSEEDAIVKEAQLYGASVCDGFMQRMGMYENAADEIQKEAGYSPEVQTPHIGEFHKVASSHYHDDEGNIHSAHDIEAYLANEEVGSEHEKLAHDSFPGVEFDARDIEVTNTLIKEAAEEGHSLTDEEAIEKVASDAHDAGYHSIMEKCAEEVSEVGYSEVMEKAAEVAHNDGYMDTMEKFAEDLAAAGETEALEELEKTAFEAGYGDAMEKIATSAFDNGYQDMTGLLAQA